MTYKNTKYVLFLYLLKYLTFKSMVMKKTILLFIAMFAVISLAMSQNVTLGNVGNHELLSSTSNASGWQVMASGVSDDLFSVHFGNSANGFVGGRSVRCLKSNDGGINWAPVAVPSVADFESVWVSSGNDALIGAWDTVYATHDGGQSWTGAYTDLVNYVIYDMQFLTPEKGFAFMTWSQFGKTTDGGATWSLTTGGGFTAWDFFGGYMVDENYGWAVGDNSLICKTTDGGESFAEYEWNGYTEFTGIRIWSVHATSTLNAWAVADSGVVFRTVDGGNYWSRSVIAGEEDNLKDIYFVNENVGYIVGTNGRIFKTSDGGNTWLPEIAITINNLNAVFFLSENLGWVVGDFGTILRYYIDDTGISDPKKDFVSDLGITPNPVSGHSSIIFTLLKKTKLQIVIRDSSGRIVKEIFEGTLTNGQHDITTDLSELSNGVYQCCFSSQGENRCTPVTIMH